MIVHSKNKSYCWDSLVSSQLNGSVPLLLSFMLYVYTVIVCIHIPVPIPVLLESCSSCFCNINSVQVSGMWKIQSWNQGLSDIPHTGIRTVVALTTAPAKQSPHVF